MLFPLLPLLLYYFTLAGLDTKLGSKSLSKLGQYHRIAVVISTHALCPFLTLPETAFLCSPSFLILVASSPGRTSLKVKCHLQSPYLQVRSHLSRLYIAKLCKKIPSKQSISTAISIHERHVAFLWCSDACCSFPLRTDHDRQSFLLCHCVCRAFGRCAIDSKSEDADSESLRKATVLCLERRWLLEEILMQPLSQQLKAVLGSSLSRGCLHLSTLHYFYMLKTP